jgi:MFS family permease
VLSASGNYVTPFAIALDASYVQIGLLNGWPNLAAALSQFLAPAIGKGLGTRRRMLLLSIALSILAWGGMMAIPFLLPGNKVWWLIALATLSLIAYYLPQGAFGSWMADLVPAKRLGKVMSARTVLASLGTIVVILGGGFILDWYDSRIFVGFSVVFGTILVLRLFSLGIFARMYEPPFDPTKEPKHRLRDLVGDTLHSNLGHYLLGYALMFYGVSISGPFFSVFWLKELHFSYLTFMAVSVSATLVTLVAVLFWGPFADRYGNVRVLRITLGVVAVVPLMWMGVDGVGKAYVVQIVAGAFWAGFSMASINFVYEASAREERVRNVAYLFAFQGIATFLGNMTGGFILPYVPEVFGSSIIALFAISGAVRLGAAAMLFTKVQEVRHIAYPRERAKAQGLHLPHLFGGRPPGNVP